MGKSKRVSSPRKVKASRTIKLSKKEIFIVFLEALIASAVISWIFYDSVWGMCLIPIVLYINFRRVSDNILANRKKVFDLEFKEMLLAISAALQSGYSIENAFKDAEENLRLLYGEKGIILDDLRQMNMKIAMREPAEKAFMEFADKNPTEEVMGFAQVFAFARRLGGDYVKNLRRTVEKMEDKLDLKQDMDTAVAEKQMELKVMCAMPFFIIAYIKFSSYEFLEPMYHNLPGIVMMSACIILYVVFVAIGKKIVQIEV